MANRRSSKPPSTEQPAATDRRAFLSTLAVGAGAATVLAALGTSRSALAQQAGGGAPAPGGRPNRPPPPPEPTESQPAPLKEVKGKTAYVTGASDGIGLGIARAFVNAGMNVVIGYRNEKRLAEAMPLFKKTDPVFPVKHDVVGRDGWVQLLDQVKAKYGKLHVVVNNAGIKTFAKASEAKPEEWQNSIDVHLGAIYHSVAVILPHMKEHGEGGHFCTTSSMSGLLPAVTAGVYTTTKFASTAIMEALRIELEGTNIGTSAFCPGGVNTDNLPPGSRPPLPDGRQRPSFGATLMDPLEAGERVLNGIRNNDLFIISHTEFQDGIRERANAILDSCPDEPVPEGRYPPEIRTRHTGIYPRESTHRKVKRKSYRG
ncbi:MAG TPA: SDR family oxidoreductase [Steroidobacteraceae bacterium]|jgi:NAD(P)-dependent dehydrogenase (short-subunit alcohol dehydrogenase family)